jgi:hypothetical protein
MREVLQPLCRAWVGVIKKAHEIKQQQFGKDADECRRFLDGPYDWMYSGKYATQGGPFSTEDNVPSPTFRMTSNKVADVVQLYGPALYSRNPHRMVTPRILSDYPFEKLAQKYPDPQMQQAIIQQMQMQVKASEDRKKCISGLFQDLLNATPNELDLQWHSRQAIDEALITGLGLLWTEPYRPPGSDMVFVGSFFDTVDNLLIDPDMETWKDAWWIARRCIAPVWELEKEYSLPKGSLKGSLESAKMQGTVNHSSADYNYFRKRGDTQDLAVYWKIYSRMGIGHKMSENMNVKIRASSEVLDAFGDNVYLVVSEHFDEFMNLHSGHGDITMDQLTKQISWPTPFWKDPTDPWPATRFVFHERQRKPWPMSHVKPALGELKFMNWVLSFLADKVKNTSRDFIAVLKGASEDFKTNVLSGSDLTLLEFERLQGSISNVVQFLQHPPFNRDILEVYEILRQEWEQRTGLSMLMYGETARQMRSATEAQQKSGQVRIRPDDMAQKVEWSSTLAARKEAIAAYWHYKENHLNRLLGPERSQLYQEYVMQEMTLDDVVYDLDIRIEAGSIRKPNKEMELANANAGVSVWQGILTQYAGATGDYGPINWLSRVWAKANDMENGFVMQPPPPPQPDQQAQMEAQMEAQRAQMEAQMVQQEHQMKMQHSQEEHSVKMQQKMEEAQLKSQLDSLTGQTKQRSRQDSEQQGLLMDLQSHLQSLRHSEEDHEQDLVQDEEKHDQELRQIDELPRRAGLPA